MAEVMQRMADQAHIDLQAAERKLCEKLNALASALLASAKLDQGPHGSKTEPDNQTQRDGPGEDAPGNTQRNAESGDAGVQETAENRENGQNSPEPVTPRAVGRKRKAKGEGTLRFWLCRPRCLGMKQQDCSKIDRLACDKILRIL